MLNQYIALAAHGFQSQSLTKAASLGATVLLEVPLCNASHVGREALHKIDVIYPVSDEGPKFMEISPEIELELRLQEPSLKIAPLVIY